MNEVTWALGRRADRTYVSRAFILDQRNSRDHGQPARYVTKVFDELEPLPEPNPFDLDIERTEQVVYTTPRGRKQLKLQITRQAGQVRELVIQKVPTNAHATRMENILTLDRDQAARLVDLIRALEFIPVEGDEQTVRLDDQTIRDIFSDPEAVVGVYNRAPERFRELIENDAASTDVIAIAHRKEVIEHFRQLLTEPDFFEEERQSAPRGSAEAVWQGFLEANPWILGIGLTGQLLTSWNDDKLEQTVAGFSVSGPGKRADALLRTSGSIRSLVYAEVKHHMTDLLSRRQYRPGCWGPSEELAGAVTQVHQTLELARRQIGHALRDRAPDGSYTGDETWMLRPRSFLILGHLDQLRGSSGGVNPDRFSSFELYRRNLYEPEILTFDELLARAEWHVTLAEGVGK